MACPWFGPVSVLGIPRAIMPLGDVWTGRCLARQAAHDIPTERALREWCNLGYARGRCPDFPADEGADAVRFAVTRHSGDQISLCSVREKDYLPFDRAELIYSVAEARFITAHRDRRVEEQARAYLKSYLCRNPQPKTA